MMNVVRTFVFALMITFSTITGEVAFVMTQINQENTFKDDFHLCGKKLVEGFYQKLQEKTMVAASLSTNLALHAKDMKAIWPHVSFPNFERRCADTRKLGGASSITYSPLISSQAVRDQWEGYAEYMEGQGILLSNYSDSYDPHEGHLHNKGETVLYRNTARTVDNGIYYLRRDQRWICQNLQWR